MWLLDENNYPRAINAFSSNSSCRVMCFRIRAVCHIGTGGPYLPTSDVTRQESADQNKYIT
jgi:hypothetical protein